jgi:hypothetical protein
MPYFDDKTGDYAWFAKFCKDHGLTANFKISEMISKFRKQVENNWKKKLDK